MVGNLGEILISFLALPVRAGLACLRVAGEDSAQAAGEFKTAACAPWRWLGSHGWHFGAGRALKASRAGLNLADNG